LASPLVQVMHTPLSVISHLQKPIVMLQQQTIMPFISMQQQQVPPASMVQRFCIMLQAMASTHEQVIFIPPVHFSKRIVQRGTIIMFMVPGMPIEVPIPGLPIPGTPMPAIPGRSIIIAPVIISSPFLKRSPGDAQ
jgi:hypothetical protein